MGRQHVLQEQPVQVLPCHDLVLFRAVLVLEKEVLTAAVLILGGIVTGGKRSCKLDIRKHLLFTKFPIT